MTKLKGIRFPSMINPPEKSFYDQIHTKEQPDRALPLGQQWRSHNGRSARLRNLRNCCRSLLSSKDPEIVSAISRLAEIVVNEPEPEYGKLHLLFAAQQASFDTGISIVDSINYMIQKFQEAKEEPNEV